MNLEKNIFLNKNKHEWKQHALRLFYFYKESVNPVSQFVGFFKFIIFLPHIPDSRRNPESRILIGPKQPFLAASSLKKVMIKMLSTNFSI